MLTSQGLLITGFVLALLAFSPLAYRFASNDLRKLNSREGLLRTDDVVKGINVGVLLSCLLVLSFSTTSGEFQAVIPMAFLFFAAFVLNIAHHVYLHRRAIKQEG